MSFDRFIIITILVIPELHCSRDFSEDWDGTPPCFPSARWHQGYRDTFTAPFWTVQLGTWMPLNRLMYEGFAPMTCIDPEEMLLAQLEIC